MKILLKVFYFVFVSLILSCQNNSEKIKDIIQPIKLTAGKTDSVVISDLFYNDKYNLNFKQNENVDTKVANNKLYITANSEFEGITLLEFEIDQNIYHIPIISKKEDYYKFSFKPDRSYDKITLFGTFNGWNRTNLPMTDENGDGIYETDVALEPGIYQYKFFGDGEEIEDPENSNRISNGMGSYNSIRIIEDKNSAKFFLHVDEYNSKNPQSTFSFYLEDESNGEITKKNIFALLDNEKITDDNILVDDKYISINLFNSELENKSLRIAVSKNGRISNIQTTQIIDGKPIDNSSFTWNDAIIYSLMIDRFKDGNKANSIKVIHDSLSDKANYMGGDLEGVLEKLNDGYFEKLGINVIWISPVYDNPNDAYKEYPAPHRYYSGYHGYWPISSKTVDEHFGTIEDVKKIVNVAHEKRIKVLLDFVSNHVHKEHPYFKEHRDWFGQLELPDGRLNLRFWDEFRLTTWFEPYLPSFDYLESEEALETMTDIAVWWLKETGADGYRHDAVKHVPNEFWRKLNDKIIKEVSTARDLPVYQIGETFGSYELISSYVNNGQLNAQFNFNLYDAAIPTFVNKNTSFAFLDKEMQKTFSVYGYNHLMGNVMDSHDKNRFMAYADDDLDVTQWSAIEEGWNNPPMVDNPENYKKLILYMAYMNTIPGLPVIYYGSEFGMSGASDPDNRRMMRFDEQLSEYEKNTLAEVSKIVNLRKVHPALRYGDFYTVQADENIYAYLRSDFNERILVVLNKSIESQKININLSSVLRKNSAIDLITEESYLIDQSQFEIEIAPRSWRMLEIK